MNRSHASGLKFQWRRLLVAPPASYKAPTATAIGKALHRIRTGLELLHFFFQFTHAADQFRQLLHRDHLSLGLFVRRRRDAEHRSLVGNVTHDARFRADGGLIAELQMSRNSRLRSDHAIISKLRAARETYLSHDQTMPANDDVVRDVNK